MNLQKGYSFRKRGNNYQIIVSYKNQKFYTTYKTPKDKKLSQSKLEQEIRNCATEFLQSLSQGFSNKKYKFCEYAEYVLDTMCSNGVKKSTLSGYRNLLKRINPLIGNMELNEITPQILNRTYQKLEKDTKKQSTAVGKATLSAYLKEHNITRVEIHNHTNVATNTLTNACLGRTISLETARKISAFLNVDINTFFEVHENTEKLSQKTISSHAKLIGVILSQAEKEMLVKYNAYSKSMIPKTGTHEADYFETDEIIYILHCLENEPIKWQVIMHLLIILGGRRGEIAGLQFDKIDWENKTIRLDTNLLYNSDDGVYIDTTKSVAGNRYMPLPAQTMDLLKKYKKWYWELRIANGDRWNDSGFMFVQDDGSPMNPTSITSYCRKFGKKYNITHCHPHKFRHSYASTLIMHHMDDVCLAKSLGHSRPSTTKNLYGHIMDKTQERSASIIENAYLNQA